MTFTKSSFADSDNARLSRTTNTQGSRNDEPMMDRPMTLLQALPQICSDAPLRPLPCLATEQRGCGGGSSTSPLRREELLSIIQEALRLVEDLDEEDLDEEDLDEEDLDEEF